MIALGGGPALLRKGVNMRHRRIRQNPAASSTIGGMDTTTLLIGAAAGAAITYVLTRKTENPSQGVLPAEAGWNDPFTKSQMFLPQKGGGSVRLVDSYTTESLSFSGLDAGSPIVGDPCNLALNGTNISQMRERIDVPNRVAVIGIAEFSLDGKQAFAWLVMSDGREVIVGANGNMNRELTELRSKTIEDGRQLAVIWRGQINYVRDYRCLGTLSIQRESQFSRVKLQNTASPRGNFSKFIR